MLCPGEPFLGNSHGNLAIDEQARRGVMCRINTKNDGSGHCKLLRALTHSVYHNRQKVSSIARRKPLSRYVNGSRLGRRQQPTWFLCRLGRVGRGGDPKQVIDLMPSTTHPVPWAS